MNRIFRVTLIVEQESHHRHPLTWAWKNMVPGVVSFKVKQLRSQFETKLRIRNRRTASARGRVRGRAR